MCASASSRNTRVLTTKWSKSRNTRVLNRQVQNHAGTLNQGTHTHPEPHAPASYGRCVDHDIIRGAADAWITQTQRIAMDWTTWWLWRGARTRSLPELGRENPQRPWYCVLRHGRVGRRQVFQSIANAYPEHPRGVEQPGSSSGS